MAKKRKKTPGGVNLPDEVQSAAAASQAKASKSKAIEQQQPMAPQFAEIEKSWREMSDQTFFRSAVGITVLATFLRYFMLLLRPVHHDEGVNGWMLTNLLRDNKYQYDPSNYHGPTIYFIAF